MPATDLPFLIEAAEKAGDIASQYSGPNAKRWDKPDGAGPVTEADLAVDAYLLETLMAQRPNYGWLSEETEDNTARCHKSCVFIVDPIDGTRSFAEGSRTWAHSIAVAQDGEVTAAVVYLPQRELMFVAAKGEGARCNGEPISVSQRNELTGASVLATKNNLDPMHWRDGDVPAIERAHRPSLAYRLARVAQGHYDAMLTLRPSWEWDIAAGDLLIREAGGISTTRSGEALKFNNLIPQLDGVIAANPTLHKNLHQQLKPV